MKIFRGKEEKYDELMLNKDGEFVNIEERGYLVHIESSDEHEKLQQFIRVALKKEIDVYETTSSFRKLEVCESKILCSSNPIIMFLTTDKNKFGSLDFVIKNIMVAFNKTETVDTE